MGKLAMNFVFGEYEYRLDSKGRVVIPPKFREFLGGNPVITKGLDGCLFVFAREEWQSFEKKLSALPVADAKARAFTRFFFAGAQEVSPDKQGRISLPTGLRQFAELKKNVMVVGVSDRIEIWDSDNWRAYNSDTTDIADKMAELGI